MDGRRRLLPLPPRPLTAHQPSGGSHGLHHLCLPQAVTDHSSASWTLFCAAASIFLQLYLYPAVHISFSRSLFSRRQQHFPAVIYPSAEKCNSWLKSCYSVWAEHRQQIPAVPIQFCSVLLPPSFSTCILLSTPPSPDLPCMCTLADPMPSWKVRLREEYWSVLVVQPTKCAGILHQSNIILLRVLVSN